MDTNLVGSEIVKFVIGNQSPLDAMVRVIEFMRASPDYSQEDKDAAIRAAECVIGHLKKITGNQRVCGSAILGKN